MTRRIVQKFPAKWWDLEPSVLISLQEAFRELLERYSDEQLVTIVDFLSRSAQRSQEFIASLPSKQRES